ncbi:Alpha-1A adrenergic receptor [Stylophora pistillata]|uniref:Alpha-1A adrenergic receptor n=1 Tax=Stylophora pistillata TaxID=50429 RepID=A0A2B4RXA7_STYPI|nr:Alpha-1A adrenergic receptor [Stylophora pistillata]
MLVAGFVQGKYENLFKSIRGDKRLKFCTYSRSFRADLTQNKSLSVADILVALLAMPFWLVLQLTDMDEKSRNVFSGELYSFWASIDILVGSASIMNLVAVSFDRHLAITAPFSYSKSLTSFRAIIMIVALWVFSILLCGLHVPAVKTAKMRSAYQIGLVVVSFIVPLFLMFVMYMKIYFVARNQALRIGRNYAKDIKATKTIAIVIGAFVVCWMPFFAILTLYALKPDYKVNTEGMKAIKWLEYLNSFLNPIIYTCLNRTYRRAFRKLLLRSSCCTGRGSSGRLNCVQSTHSSFHKTKAESLSHSSSSVSENGNVYTQRSPKMEGTRV